VLLQHAGGGAPSSGWCALVLACAALCHCKVLPWLLRWVLIQIRGLCCASFGMCARRCQQHHQPCCMIFSCA